MNPLIQLEKICLVCVAVSVCYGLSPAVNANTITVTNKNDSGLGSLRAALAVAHDGDTIDATGVSGRILLTSGALQITHNVTVNGPSAAHLAVNGNAASSVFENFASDVTISHFTITNGFSSGGGGIFNTGGLTVVYSTISNNVATCGQERYRICAGGGIYSSGALTVANSTINDNTAPCWGGGIYASGALTVVNSTISSNSAMPDGGVGLPCLSGEGGGIFVGGSGTLTITNSTLSGNMSQLGGGIFNSGQVTIGDTVLDAGG